MDLELADLFFRADRQLSETEALRTNELRRNYRMWRQGDMAGPHADVLLLNHIIAVDEQRSTAKMKRTKTFGDKIDRLSGAESILPSKQGSPLLGSTQACAPPLMSHGFSSDGM